jgi:hypothetical protein
MILRQTPIRSQESRGTCSIFSATALLESMLVLRGDFAATNLDLAEEWLQYVVKRGDTKDGSNSGPNFEAFGGYGMPFESTLPYVGHKWENASGGLAEERCGKLLSYDLASCLIGHFSPALLFASDDELENEVPAFLAARREAYGFRDERLHDLSGSFSSWVSEWKVKELLREGTPLTVDLKFFYGAWNHRLAAKLGMERDMDAWAGGVIGYPERGSLDRTASLKEPAGHSIVIVGYDDEKEVRTRVKMEDGSYREFVYRGVYYFKNSWGASNFGAQFMFDGVAFPGYGMMTQKYAHEFGSFYALPIRLGRQ